MFDIFIKRLEDNNFYSGFVLLPDPATIRRRIMHVQLPDIESVLLVNCYPASGLPGNGSGVNRSLSTLPANFAFLGCWAVKYKMRALGFVQHLSLYK